MGWAPEQIAGWVAGNERGLRALGFEAIYAFIYRVAHKGEDHWRYLTRRHKRWGKVLSAVAKAASSRKRPHRLCFLEEINDCRPRRALLTSLVQLRTADQPTMLVTQDPTRTFDAFSTALQSQRERESRFSQSNSTEPLIDANFRCGQNRQGARGVLPSPTLTPLHGTACRPYCPWGNIARAGRIIGSAEVSCKLIREKQRTWTSSREGPMMFASAAAYPPADLKLVVQINFDTVYSLGWLDLTREPVVVSSPDTNGRYFLLPMLDMWTDVFASPGWRTTGTQNFLIVPPGGQPDVRDRVIKDFKLPKDMQRIDATMLVTQDSTRTGTVADACCSSCSSIKAVFEGELI
jgi:hypothetical protein